MKKPTQQIKIAAWLEAAGFIPIRNPHTTYMVYQHPKEPSLHMFVGRAGALRWGRTMSESRPVLEQIRRDFMRMGEEELAVRADK